MLKKALLTSAAIAATTVSGIAAADVTGNLTVTSNYIFRGVASDNAAVQGGLDWSNKNGVYAGTWLSNVASTGQTEVDFYAGFATGMFDVGVLAYTYPGAAEADGSTDNQVEIYGGLAQDAWSAKVSYNFGSDEAEDDEFAYIEGGYSIGNVDLHAGYLLGVGDNYDGSCVTGGETNCDDGAIDVSAAYNIGDFAMGVSLRFDDNGQGAADTDEASEERPAFFVSYSKEFAAK